MRAKRSESVASMLSHSCVWIEKMCTITCKKNIVKRWDRFLYFLFSKSFHPIFSLVLLLSSTLHLEALPCSLDLAFSQFSPTSPVLLSSSSTESSSDVFFISTRRCNRIESIKWTVSIYFITKEHFLHLYFRSSVVAPVTAYLWGPSRRARGKWLIDP